MAKKTTTKTGTDLVKWDEELANLAKATSKGLEVSEGKFISFKNGKMKFAGSEIEDNELECVIVGWTNHNAYYDPKIPYDSDNPQSPICYSFGQDKDEMQPHEDSPDKQNDACAGCPFNEFETDSRGKGKACKNTYRLALIASSDLENLDGAEVVYASIPPKSLKNFANYVKKDLAKLERPHWSVITKMSVRPDGDSQFIVEFELHEKIEEATLFGPLKDLWQKTMEGIEFPYQEREAPPPKAAKKTKFGKR